MSAKSKVKVSKLHSSPIAPFRFLLDAFVQTPATGLVSTNPYVIPEGLYLLLQLVASFLGISAAIIFGVWSIKSYEVSKQSLSVAQAANSIALSAASSTPTVSADSQAASLLAQLQLANRLELFALCGGGYAVSIQPHLSSKPSLIGGLVNIPDAVQ
ncbi:MAG: hypothetical protein M1814_005656 [Vezdaea aestivalis]|nr:MAG: hypothetical protein M1814_005656 [Vezdaea aestivalis]